MGRKRQNWEARWKPTRVGVKTPKLPSHLNSPRDERLMALEVGLIQGTVSVVGATVPLASLRVHHPQTLHRARASLREEPSLHAAIVQRVVAGGRGGAVCRGRSGGGGVDGGLPPGAPGH